MAIRQDPSGIFKVLLWAFGDGDTLRTLQRSSLVTSKGRRKTCCGYRYSWSRCTIEFVASTELTCHVRRGVKGALAKAARDEGVRHELLRLTIESGHLTHFDMRDRVIAWLGSSGTQSKVTIREISE